MLKSRLGPQLKKEVGIQEGLSPNTGTTRGDGREQGSLTSTLYESTAGPQSKDSHSGSYCCQCDFKPKLILTVIKNETLIWAKETAAQEMQVQVAT